jgi:hypothetical protein
MLVSSFVFISNIFFNSHPYGLAVSPHEAKQVRMDDLELLNHNLLNLIKVISAKVYKKNSRR